MKKANSVGKNDRLSAALKVAAKPKKKRAKSTYYFADRNNARKARAKGIAKMGKRIATTPMRIQTDAIALAKSAWPKKEVRIVETSGAIRDKAKKVLGL